MGICTYHRYVLYWRWLQFWWDYPFWCLWISTPLQDQSNEFSAVAGCILIFFSGLLCCAVLRCFVRLFSLVTVCLFLLLSNGVGMCYWSYSVLAFFVTFDLIASSNLTVSAYVHVSILSMYSTSLFCSLSLLRLPLLNSIVTFHKLEFLFHQKPFDSTFSVPWRWKEKSDFGFFVFLINSHNKWWLRWRCWWWWRRFKWWWWTMTTWIVHFGKFTLYTMIKINSPTQRIRTR